MEYRALNRIPIRKVANNHMEVTNSTQAFIDSEPFADNINTITHDPRQQSIMLESQEQDAHQEIFDLSTLIVQLQDPAITKPIFDQLHYPQVIRHQAVLTLAAILASPIPIK